MQFRAGDKRAIARGEITLSFRRWRRPQAKAGGRYRVGEQVIEVTSVERIDPSAISIDDARAAGRDSPAAVIESIRVHQHRSADPDAPIYCVAFRCLGALVDSHSVLAADDQLDELDLDAVAERLRRMDARSRRGTWTRATLAAIAEAPGRRAADLAAQQGCETQAFKADVRKLKALGLTISLETGYELSPRGRAVFESLLAGSDGADI